MKQTRGIDERIAHVVAVAHPGNFGAGDVAAVLDKSLHVSEHLAGMITIREGVDDRNGGILRKSFETVLAERAHGDNVHHSRQHAGGVLDGLAAAELGIPGREKDCRAAELKDPRLE